MNSHFNTYLSNSIIFTLTKSQILTHSISLNLTSLKFLVLQMNSQSFSHDISTSSIFHSIKLFLLVTLSSNSSFNLCHLIAFSSLLISSG